jgi:hypothetical protein
VSNAAIGHTRVPGGAVGGGVAGGELDMGDRTGLRLAALEQQTQKQNRPGVKQWF